MAYSNAIPFICRIISSSPLPGSSRAEKERICQKNDEEASDRAPMHFEIFPRVVQYRRSVSVAAGESFEKFLWTGYAWGEIPGGF